MTLRGNSSLSNHDPLRREQISSSHISGWLPLHRFSESQSLWMLSVEMSLQRPLAGWRVEKRAGGASSEVSIVECQESSKGNRYLKHLSQLEMMVFWSERWIWKWMRKGEMPEILWRLNCQDRYLFLKYFLLRASA